tara:strand:- start:166 stop:312 length:147 start_codon:yes stop_codon:yes gene_type:complete
MMIACVLLLFLLPDAEYLVGRLDQGFGRNVSAAAKTKIRRYTHLYILM